jgi:hypothetical protein
MLEREESMKTRRILATILLLTMPLFAMSFGVAKNSIVASHQDASVMVSQTNGAEIAALGLTGGKAIAFSAAAVLVCAATGAGAIGCGLLAVA